MALHAKNLKYRVEEISPAVGQIEIFKISGQKQLPVIMDEDGQIISDSSNICKFIDNKNTNNTLYPSDPIHLSQSIIIEDWADTTMATVCKQALIKSALENPQLRSALLPNELPSSIRGLVQKLPFNNLSKISNVVISNKPNIELQKILESLSKSLIDKKFIIGETLTIADIAIAAQLSLLKFPNSSGPILKGEGCQEYINNPYLDNLFNWRDRLEEYLFSANSL